MTAVAIALLLAGLCASWFVLRRPRQASASGADVPAQGTRVDEILKERCKGSPQMISLNLPPSLPGLPLEPGRVEETLGLFLEFFQRRRVRGILVAAGCGALSVEVVMADAGPDIPDGERRAFLDWSVPLVPARLELDERMREAHAWLLACGGSLALEARLEGGICLRCRFPRGGSKA